MAFSPYMNGMSAEQIRSGIQSMDPGRRSSLISRAFPGTPLPKGLTVAEALHEAGANFNVTMAPQHTKNPVTGEWQESRKSVGLLRTDTGAEVGSATGSYGIIQSVDCFAAAQALVERGTLSLDFCQVVDGGAKVRLGGLIGSSTIYQASRPDDADILAHFVLFEANHSGAGKSTGQLYTLRLACFNGMTSKELAGQFGIAHYANGTKKMLEASAALLHVHEAAVEEAAIFQRLALHELSLTRFREFAVDLLDDTRGFCDVDEDSKARVTRRVNDIEELENYFLKGAGNAGRTHYDAYNAVTDWLTPRRERLKDAQAFAKRFESTTSGNAATVRSRALNLLSRW